MRIFSVTVVAWFRCLNVLTLCAIGLFAATPVFAANDDRVALVIGNDQIGRAHV